MPAHEGSVAKPDNPLFSALVATAPTTPLLPCFQRSQGDLEFTGLQHKLG